MNQRMSNQHRDRDYPRSERMRDYGQGSHYRGRDDRDWRSASPRDEEYRRRYSSGGEYLRDTTANHREGWPDVGYEYEHSGDYADEVVGGDYTRGYGNSPTEPYERTRDYRAAEGSMPRYRGGRAANDSRRPYGGYGERGGYAENATSRDDRGSLYGSSAHGGSHRGKGPRNYTRSDERIREDLCERLTEDDSIDASDIDIEVQNGVVTLNGSVEQRWIKHRVEDVAEDCSGVKDVVNQLRVEPAQNSVGAASHLA